MPPIIVTGFRFLPWVLVVVLVVLNIRIFTTSSETALNDDGVWEGRPLPGKPLALAELDIQADSTASSDDEASTSGKQATPQTVAPVQAQAKKAPVAAKAVVAATPVTRPKDVFYVQAGSYVQDLGVDFLLERLREEGLEPHLRTVRERIHLNNVQAGPFTSLEVAKEAETKLRAAGMAVDVEETWDGFILYLSQSPLLGYAVQAMENARNAGVSTLRVVKSEVDRPVKKVLLGPFATKQEAKKVSAAVSKLGLTVPLIQRHTPTQ